MPENKQPQQAPKTTTEKVKVDSVRTGKQKLNPNASTQIHLPISEIHDDTVVLKNGGIRGILTVSSVNFNLKSEDEQKSILYSYQGFLNTLSFPIQIVIKSKKLDVDIYLEKLRKLAEKQENRLLQKQTFEYADYIQKLVEYADIMEKDFYVIVPFDPYRAKRVSTVQKLMQKLKGKDTFTEIQRKKEEFQELKKGLSTRMSTVRTGLENCGLKVDELKTKDLIELFYKIYNPVTSRQEKGTELDETTLESEIMEEK